MQGNSIKLNIHIIANAALGPYLSGGDRIFIECARRWASWGNKITIYVWEEGREMCRRNGLEGVDYIIWPAERYKRFGFGFNYLMRVLVGVSRVLKMKGALAKGKTIVYSSSDFWPDSFPAFLLHKKLKGSKWVAGFYLFAPNPFKGFRGMYKKGIKIPSLKEFLYYIHQWPVYHLIKNKANMVFVTCDEDKERFVAVGRNPLNVVAVKGGVFAKDARGRLVEPDSPKAYDACFVGRFHPQKGIIELIKIWRYVCNSRPAARLAVIGAGSPAYHEEVLKEINAQGLKKSIDLLGFIDGEDKYRVFTKSMVIVHPAVYDSGGMAACEGMAWGLPAVGFDLPALRTYYPKGMLKSPLNNLEAFAGHILSLLNDPELYLKTRQDALTLAMEWDWDQRAKDILNVVERGLDR